MSWPGPSPVRPPTAEQEAADLAAIAAAGLDVGEYQPIYDTDDCAAVMNGDIGAASRHHDALVATEDVTVDYDGEPIELKAGETMIWPDHKLASTHASLFTRSHVRPQDRPTANGKQPVRARSSIGSRRSRGTRRRQSAARAGSDDSDPGEPDDSDARLARAVRRSRAPPSRSRTSGCVATVTAACASSLERPTPR